MRIEVKGLTHVYSEGMPFETVALEDVNFVLEPGSFTGLIGHTGSGKSTLVEMMVFNTGANSRRGRMEDGTTVAGWDDEAIRGRISVGADMIP